MISIIIVIVIIILFSPSLMTQFKIISHRKVKYMQCHELQRKLGTDFLLHERYMVKNGAHFNHEICKAMDVPLQNTDSLLSAFLYSSRCALPRTDLHLAVFYTQIKVLDKQIHYAESPLAV